MAPRPRAISCLGNILRASFTHLHHPSNPMAALASTSPALAAAPRAAPLSAAAGKLGQILDARAWTRDFPSSSACASFTPSRALSAVKARAVSTSASDSELLKALEEELKFEEDNYEPPESLSKKPPEGFVLESNPGAAEAVLRKSYQGEDIALVIAPPEEEPEEFDENQEEKELDDDEEGENLPDERYIPVKMTVTKKGADGLLQTLEIELSLEVENDWVVESVRSKSSNVPEGSIAYSGPDYFTLDPALQDQFQAYVQRRGLTSRLGEFVRDCVDDKDQREYEGWLKRVKDFVAS